MSRYSGLDAIKSPFDKSAEIISLWPSTAEIKSAEINSGNSVAKSQKFIPAEITRYTVFGQLVDNNLYTFWDTKVKGQGHKVTLDENAYSEISLSFIIPSSSNLAGW